MKAGFSAADEAGLGIRADCARIVDVARSLQCDVIDGAQIVAQRCAGAADFGEHALGVAARTAVARVERDRLPLRRVLQRQAQEQLVGCARLDTQRRNRAAAAPR